MATGDGDKGWQSHPQGLPLVSGTGHANVRQLRHAREGTESTNRLPPALVTAAQRQLNQKNKRDTSVKDASLNKALAVTRQSEFSLLAGIV